MRISRTDDAFVNCEISHRVILSSDHRPITITLNLPAEQLRGQERLVWDWNKGNLPAFINFVDEGQICQECESRKMKANEMHSRMCAILSYAILSKAAQKHIGLKAVGMAGRCWMTKDINDKLKVREQVRRSEGIHTEAYKRLNKEVSRLSTEVKRRIWQRKVLEAKGKSEMWQVLKNLTDIKPTTTPTSSVTMVEPVRANVKRPMLS